MTTLQVGDEVVVTLLGKVAALTGDPDFPVVVEMESELGKMVECAPDEVFALDELGDSPNDTIDLWGKHGTEVSAENPDPPESQDATITQLRQRPSERDQHPPTDQSRRSWDSIIEELKSNPGKKKKITYGSLASAQTTAGNVRKKYPEISVLATTESDGRAVIVAFYPKPAS